MSTSLYKSMKQRGSTFYAFPSTKHHTNPNFSKFVLLNIPARENDKILDFDLDALNGAIFDIYTDNINPTSTYADQLIESLRNYVANQDTTYLESKINNRKEFYNIQELKTPTEKIFWKWLRKMKAIDFEPAEHKIDWDKNLIDFENPYADTTTNLDYFRKYLWKEREPIDYLISNITEIGGGKYELFIEYFARFRVGDKVYLSGDNIGDFSYENLYTVDSILYDNNTTTVTIDTDVVGPQSGITNAYITLNYHKLVQYIGEINVKSDVMTASKNETEIIAYIPHQAGKTPTILFDITSDTNYYPGLELPLLPEQIQTEIRGAENYTSPIRQKPSEYPGLYFGQFDNDGNTYENSTGDKLRLKGEYYGIILNNNVGLYDDNYKEKLSDFNSTNLDGIGLDFDLDHYLKMQILDKQVGYNFDEFNQLSIDGQPPQNFEYNAILWYYDVDDADGNAISNLYGITFLNNPDNDDDNDPDHISTYEKLVSTEDHDGLSYQHVLNITTSMDNDTSSLSFDPLSLNNTFGFDLYSNVMSNLGKLNESFLYIINDFIRINNEMNGMKSIVYSQTDLDLIKSKLLNLENLLKLYSTYQFVDTDTVKIESNYGGVYPTLGFNVKNVEYDDIIKLTSTNIYDHIILTESDKVITIPDNSKLFINITNDDITNYLVETELNILLSKDLKYKQTVELYLDALNAKFPNKLNVYINYSNGDSYNISKEILINNLYLPVDIMEISGDNIYYHRNKYLSESVFKNVISSESIIEMSINKTKLYTDSTNIFGNNIYNEYVYINDLKYIPSGGTINDMIDASGMYQIDLSGYTNEYITINLDSSTYGTMVGNPKIYSYKYLKIKIIRVDESSTSTISDRYLIQKMFI